jgi:uncharacterized alpha-E superfamily protein
MLSRVADSMYWMSRYLERAEHTARLIDLNLVLMLDQPSQVAEQRWARLFESLRIEAPADALGDPRRVTELLTFDRTTRNSILGALEAARDNARHVREQLSSEMWEQLNRLYLQVQRTRIDDIWNVQTHAFFENIKNGAHLFQGITDATLGHGEGWQFIQLGRFIERASATAALLDAHVGGFVAAPQQQHVTDYLDWVGVLKSCTAFEAYCQVYTADLQPARIAEFLLLNAECPRTIRFAVRQMQSALDAIAAATGTRRAGQATRIVGRLRARLEYGQIDEIMADDMHAFLNRIEHDCRQLHAVLNNTYFAPPLESVLAS